MLDLVDFVHLQGLKCDGNCYVLVKCELSGFCIPLVKLFMLCSVSVKCDANCFSKSVISELLFCFWFGFQSMNQLLVKLGSLIASFACLNSSFELMCHLL